MSENYVGELRYGQPLISGEDAARSREVIEAIQVAASAPIRFLPRAWLATDGREDVLLLRRVLDGEVSRAKTGNMPGPSARLTAMAEEVQDRYLRQYSRGSASLSRADQVLSAVEAAESRVPPQSRAERAMSEYYKDKIPQAVLRLGAVEALIEDGQLALASSALERTKDQFRMHRDILLQGDSLEPTCQAIGKALFEHIDSRLPLPPGSACDRQIEAAATRLEERLAELELGVTGSSFPGSEKADVAESYRSYGARVRERIMRQPAFLSSSTFRFEIAGSYAGRVTWIIHLMGLAEAHMRIGQVSKAYRHLNTAQNEIEAMQRQRVGEGLGPEEETRAALHDAIFSSGKSGGRSIGMEIQEGIRALRSRLDDKIFELEARSRRP